MNTFFRFLVLVLFFVVFAHGKGYIYVKGYTYSNPITVFEGRKESYATKADDDNPFAAILGLMGDIVQLDEDASLVEKNNGVVYVNGVKKGNTSYSAPLTIGVKEGEHLIEICYPYDKNGYYAVCGAKRVYVGNDTESLVEIEAKSRVLTEEGEKIKKPISNDADREVEMGIKYIQSKNYEMGRYYFEKACNRGYPKGCVGLGYLYFQGGYGVEQSNERAEKYFQKACNAFSVEGCSMLKEVKKK